MRKFLIGAGLVLATTSLGGCDFEQKAPAPQVAQQPCECKQEVAALEERLTRLSINDSEDRHVRRHVRQRTVRHHAHSAEEYFDDEYAQVTQSSPYSSRDSFREYRNGPPPPPPPKAQSWTDGYGRTHYYNVAVRDSAHMAVNSAQHKKPWWRYDEDCDK